MVRTLVKPWQLVHKFEGLAHRIALAPEDPIAAHDERLRAAFVVQLLHPRGVEFQRRWQTKVSPHTHDHLVWLLTAPLVPFHGTPCVAQAPPLVKMMRRDARFEGPESDAHGLHGVWSLAVPSDSWSWKHLLMSCTGD